MKRVKWLDKECNSCCEKCIAKEYDKTPGELREQMENFFGMRPCQGI